MTGGEREGEDERGPGLPSLALRVLALAGSGRRRRNDADLGRLHRGLLGCILAPTRPLLQNTPCTPRSALSSFQSSPFLPRRTPMASQLARTILTRRKQYSPSSLDKLNANDAHRAARLRAPLCAHKVRDARNEPDDDGGRHCLVEEEGGRIFRCRRRPPRNCAPFRVSHHSRILMTARRRRTRPPSTSKRRKTVFSPKSSFVVPPCCTSLDR